MTACPRCPCVHLSELRSFELGAHFPFLIKLVRMCTAAHSHITSHYINPHTIKMPRFFPFVFSFLNLNFFLFLHYSMQSPCDSSSLDTSNSFPNDVDPSSPPSNNAISHKVVPSSQYQRKQPLVDRCLSTINPDISQPSCALSNPVVQTTISRFVYSTPRTTNTNLILDHPILQ